MRVESENLAGDSPGGSRSLKLFRYGEPGKGPKVYLQAGLHADEMPGMLVLHHLMPLLASAEARGTLAGEVLVVPVANPIGLSQWVFQKPVGRFDTDTMENFNRHYPDLAALVGDDLDGKLTSCPDENGQIIRDAFRAALARQKPMTDLQELRLILLAWCCDADYVLDLHCDHEAVMHLYASPARPEDTARLCRAVGARLALIQEVSGGNAFDEAASAPWGALRRRFGERHPVPAGPFSATLEYRGQFDVSDDLAAEDARNLMDFLAAVGVMVEPGFHPRHSDAVHYPLGGTGEAFAPSGGIVTWRAEPGEWVREGQTIAEVIDPLSSERHVVTAPNDGMMFRRELWRSCLRGQSLAHVAGERIVREGHLLSN